MQHHHLPTPSCRLPHGFRQWKPPHLFNKNNRFFLTGMFLLSKFIFIIIICTITWPMEMQLPTSQPWTKLVQTADCKAEALPLDGAQQRGSGLVVEGDDDGCCRKIWVVVKSAAPASRESNEHDIWSIDPGRSVMCFSCNKSHRDQWVIVLRFVLDMLKWAAMFKLLMQLRYRRNDTAGKTCWKWKFI